MFQAFGVIDYSVLVWSVKEMFSF